MLSVSASSCRFLPVPARSSPALSGPGCADTRLPRQQPPQLSSNHRACYCEQPSNHRQALRATAAGLRWLGGGALRMRLKAAPTAVRTTGKRAHGEGGRKSPTGAKRGKARGRGCPCSSGRGSAPGGARGTASSRPNRAAERGFFRPAPQNPVLIGWARPHPSHDSQSSPSPLGRAFD